MRIVTLRPSEHDFDKSGLRSGARLLVAAEIAHPRHRPIKPKLPFSAGTTSQNPSSNAASGTSSRDQSRSPTERTPEQAQHTRGEVGQTQTQHDPGRCLRPAENQNPPQRQHVDQPAIAVCHHSRFALSYPLKAGCHGWTHPACALPKTCHIWTRSTNFSFLANYMSLFADAVAASRPELLSLVSIPDNASPLVMISSNVH
jgi:hypothetical protein